MAHTPVLLQETITGLAVLPGETYLDATVGSGGHALALGNILGKEGRVIGLDQDGSSIEKARETLSSLLCEVTLVQENFRHLDTVLSSLGISQVDRILFDIGVHSDQFGPSLRGFSFMHNEPLLMTMGENKENKLTAKDIVNFWSKADIENVLVGYGEEAHASAIAEAIVKVRRDTPIETTFDLVCVIESAVPAWYKRKKIHPATKTFQALRIAVNDELDALREGLAKGLVALRSGGRMAIITFHSLEARIVKEFCKQVAKEGKGKLITKHAIRPAWTEVKDNRRARSAQLRIIEKI